MKMNLLITLVFFVFGFFTQLNAQYCIPTYGTGCTVGDDIDNFVLYNAGINHIGSGCSANAYGDFTGDPTLVGDLEASVTYNFEITHNYASQYVRIYIDFNNNDDFEDPGELLFTSTTGSNLTTGSITIPAGATQTTTRMRIVDAYASVPTNSCNPGSTYGETHDYEVNILPPPTCPAPINLVNNNITATEAEMGWTSQGTETNWNLEYGAPGYTPGTGTNMATTNNPETITGLTPATAYDVYVQADCGGNDTSTWSGPITIFTNCTVFNAPYSENFDGATWVSGTGATNTGDAINQCWSRNPNSAFFFGTRTGTTGSTSTGPSADFSGTGNYVFTEGSYGSTGDIATITSPLIDLSALTAPFLTFYYHMYGQSITSLDVQISDDGGATWTTETSIIGEQQTSSADAWTELEVNITSYANQTIQVRFSTAKGASFYNDLAIDEVVVDEAPPCPKPTDFVASNVTTNSVDLNWTPGYNETDWNIEYGAPGYTPGTGTTVATTNNPETLGGLTPATAYDIYIQADCGADSSDWVGPITIFTNCVVFTAPYTENFDGATWVSGTGFNNTGDDINQCWSRNPGTGFFFGTRTGTTNNTTTGPSDDYTGGGKYIYTEASGGTNGDTATITTPDIDLSTLTDPYMTFYYHMFGADITSLEVEVSNDGGLTWVNEASIVGQQQTASADYWRDQPLDLSAYTGDVIQVRFLTVKAGFNADLAIDEIEIDEAPTCPKPTNLDTTNITDTEITVDWTNGGTETNWNIEYGPTGFTQGTGTTVPVTTNPFNITGLTPDTGYDIYIQADCGGGDLSDWTFPINVTTECSDEIAPYLQPFNSGTQPNCWDNTSSNSTSANALWKFTGTPGYGATANGRPAGSYAWTDGSTPIVNDVTLLSPNIDMSTLTVPMLSFDWFSNNEDNPGDNVPLIIDVHDGTSWTNLITLSGDSPDWQDVEITLGAYIGQTVKFRFICDQTATSGLAQYNDILLDSVLIDEAPTCPKPITLDVSNVTANDVDVDWTQGYQETEWIIEYDTAGFVLGSGNTITTNNLSEVITGLTELTDYEVYIRAICSPGDTSDYTGPESFTTACDVYPAPFYEPFDNGVQPDCWDNQATGSANNDFWLFDGAPGYGATSNGKPVDTYAWSDGSGGEPEGTLITPFIDLTTINDPYLTFEWFSNNTNFPGDNVPLYIEINGGSVWTPLDTLQGDDPNWLEEAYDLSAYEDSIVRIRFITDHTATINSAFYNDVLVDDVHVWPCNAEPSVDGVLDACVLEDSVNLNNVITITPQPLDTRWSFPTSPSLITNDSILVITTLPAGTYPVYYIVDAACTSDTTVADITVYPAHQAGPNGSVTVCLNEPVDLSDGLSGNYDLGGNWYDPYDSLMPNDEPTTPAIPTTYNYDYITTTNSVCPADTALIELIVDGNCDFLLIDGENLSNIKVYPNPASDIINIENTSDNESLQIEILDMNGRVVLTDSKSLDNVSKAEIAIDYLQKGIYALRIFNSNGQHTFRIVKQ